MCPLPCPPPRLVLSARKFVLGSAQILTFFWAVRAEQGGQSSSPRPPPPLARAHKHKSRRSLRLPFLSPLHTQLAASPFPLDLYILYLY